MISDAQLQREIDFATGDIQQMRTLIGRLRGTELNERTAFDYGLLPTVEFASAFQRERDACLEIDDAISLIEIDVQEELSNETELELYRELRGLAMQPGSIIGKLDDTRYQLALPWTDEHHAQRAQAFVAGIIADTFPDIALRIGHATVSHAQPIAEPQLADAPNRALIVRTGRLR